MKVSELNEFSESERALIETIITVKTLIEDGFLGVINGSIDDIVVPVELQILMAEESYNCVPDSAIFSMFAEFEKAGIIVRYTPLQKIKSIACGDSLMLGVVDMNNFKKVFEEQSYVVA